MGPRAVAGRDPDRPDGVGKATPDRGVLGSPDGVDPNIRRTRHNVTVITVGSKYTVYVRSPASSQTQTLQTKWEVNIFLKKSSCVFLPASFIPASSFMRLTYGVVVMLHEHVYVYISIFIMWVYNISRFGACARRVLQGLRMNLVTVNYGFRHHNTTATKGTKRDAGIERSNTKKQEQTSNKQMNRLMRKERKKRKKRKEEGNVLEDKKKKKKQKEKKKEGERNRPTRNEQKRDGKKKRKKIRKLIATFL